MWIKDLETFKDVCEIILKDPDGSTVTFSFVGDCCCLYGEDTFLEYRFDSPESLQYIKEIRPKFNNQFFEINSVVENSDEHLNDVQVHEKANSEKTVNDSNNKESIEDLTAVKQGRPYISANDGNNLNYLRSPPVLKKGSPAKLLSKKETKSSLQNFKKIETSTEAVQDCQMKSRGRQPEKFAPGESSRVLLEPPVLKSKIPSKSKKEQKKSENQKLSKINLNESLSTNKSLKDETSASKFAPPILKKARPLNQKTERNGIENKNNRIFLQPPTLKRKILKQEAANKKLRSSVETPPVLIRGTVLKEEPEKPKASSKIIPLPPVLITKKSTLERN